MLRRSLLCLLIVALYAITGVVGLSLASWGDQVTLLWAPTGISLGALMVGGRGLWPGVWLGSLIVNLWAGDVSAAPIIATGNTLEAVVGAILLERAGLRHGLDRLEDVRSFLSIGVAGCTTIAATVGTLTLVAGQASLREGPLIWLLWWLGDATGALVLTPLVLTWSASQPREHLAPAGGLALLVLAIGLGGFFTTGPHTLPLVLVTFPIVFGAALRFGLPVAAALGALNATLAVAGPLVSRGPFNPDHTWAYLVVLGSSTLVVAALAAERRAAQERQRQVEAAALEAQRLEALGLIAAGVAHDFNNLLQVILAYASLEREEPEPEHLDRIEEAVRHAAGLVDQLLAYSGRAPSRVETIDLAQELHAISNLLRASVPETIALTLDLDPDTTARCDRAQLHQVVVNLVTNASEALAGSCGRSITIRCGQAGGMTWLEVEDDGPGMAPEVVERLFEPFFTTRFVGRGLGLASVAGIVRAHGGKIDVDSEPGRGTRMRVWLPS